MALSSVPRMFKASVQHAVLASAGQARFCDVLAKGSQRTRQAISLPRCLQLFCFRIGKDTTIYGLAADRHHPESPPDIFPGFS